MHKAVGAPPGSPKSPANHIGGADQPAHLLGILEVGAEIGPVGPPGLGDFRVFLVPALLKSVQGIRAKFWATVLNSLKNRGIEDIFIACTDNLTGFDAAIHAFNRRGRQIHLQGCRGPALHRSSDPKLAKVYSLKGLQGLYRPTQASLWRSKPKNIIAQDNVDRTALCLQVLADIDIKAVYEEEGIEFLQRTILPFSGRLYHTVCD